LDCMNSEIESLLNLESHSDALQIGGVFT
jgi:hypothetical protein